MNKTLYFSLAAALLLSAGTKASASTLRHPVTQANVQLISSSNRSAALLRQAPNLSPLKAVQKETVLSEDFSKFTAGSEAAPDDVDLAASTTIDANYTAVAGWSGKAVHQAGGVAYIGLSGGYPGFLTTPKVNLSAHDGLYTVKFRARLQGDANASDVMVVINNANNKYKNLKVTNEWQEFSVPFSGGVEDSYFDIYSDKIPLFVDDIAVISGGLPAPSLRPIDDYTGTQFTARWTAVEGATSYLVSVVGVDDDGYPTDTLMLDHETQDTQLLVTGLDAAKSYAFFVKAKAGEDVSVDSEAALVEISTLHTPQLDTATDVSTTGFTGHWSAVPFATHYQAELFLRHKAKVAESYALLNTDFSGITADVVAEGDETDGYLDDYIDRTGWYVSSAKLKEGAIAIDNSMAFMDGPQFIVSPQYDFSLDGGKATVEFTASANIDTKVQVMYSKLVDNVYTIVDQSKAQSVTVTSTPTKYSLTVDGGADGYCLLILPDADSGAEQVWFDDLKVSQNLQAGQSTYTGIHGGDVTEDTSFKFTTPEPTETDSYGYAVTALLISDDTYQAMSDRSAIQYVSQGTSGVEGTATAQASVVATANGVEVLNPQGNGVQVFDASGRLVANDNSGAAAISVELPQHGFYVVKVGTQSLKFVR